MEEKRNSKKAASVTKKPSILVKMETLDQVTLPAESVFAEKLCPAEGATAKKLFPS